MPPSSSHVRDLLVERLEALLHDCEHVMDTSAHGHIALRRHYRRCLQRFSEGPRRDGVLCRRDFCSHSYS